MAKTHLDRLKDLREDSDKTQEEIGAYLGTTKQYYQKYEKGIRPLPIKHLISLANLYKTSTDYILGITNEQKPYPRA
ncbi:helix-turn-helix domain-containing protein [Oscillospiraceae bacterium LTW-04]|nr:helix-turn-helix transcriptional regulator [Oscillospiraceae bacterium MB24-C1]